MKKIAVFLTIGYPGAKQEDTLEFDDDATDAEIDEEVRDWAQNYIEWGWEAE